MCLDEIKMTLHWFNSTLVLVSKHKNDKWVLFDFIDIKRSYSTKLQCLKNDVNMNWNFDICHTKSLLRYTKLKLSVLEDNIFKTCYDTKVTRAGPEVNSIVLDTSHKTAHTKTTLTALVATGHTLALGSNKGWNVQAGAQPKH